MTIKCVNETGRRKGKEKRKKEKREEKKKKRKTRKQGKGVAMDAPHLISAAGAGVRVEVVDCDTGWCGCWQLSAQCTECVLRGTV